MPDFYSFNAIVMKKIQIEIYFFHFLFLEIFFIYFAHYINFSAYIFPQALQQDLILSQALESYLIRRLCYSLICLALGLKLSLKASLYFVTG